MKSTKKGKKLTLIFSDTELGAGNRTDDFIEEDLFCEVVEGLFSDAKKYQTDIVFNGDTLDFLKCPMPDGSYPRHSTENRALEKLELIRKAHSQTFKLLNKFLKLRDDNRIVLIYGNHDYELAFPKVKLAITKAICGNNVNLSKRVIYPGFEFRDGLVFIEHGSQLDIFFKVHPKKFIHKGNKHFPEPFLMIPWGHNALYEFFMEYKERYPMAERLFPKEYGLAVLPIKIRFELIFGSMWYLIKSFLYTQVVEWHDPLRRFHFSMFSRYVGKMAKQSFHLHFLKKVRRKLRRSNIQVYSVGHNHTGTIHTYRGRKILNTGSWRDEYLYNPEIDAFIPKMKSYGYVLHDNKKVHEIELREVAGHEEVIFFEDVNEKLLASDRREDKQRKRKF